MPLSLACVNGHLDRVKYLVKECHCDPNSKLLFNAPAATLSMPTRKEYLWFKAVTQMLESGAGHKAEDDGLHT